MKKKRRIVLPDEGTPITYGLTLDAHESVEVEDPDYVPPLYGRPLKVIKSVEETEPIEIKRIDRKHKKHTDPFPQIVNNFANLNPNHYGIFEYYLQHPASVANDTQAQLAKATLTSVKALRRFAVSTGFEDYVDMHHAFKAYAKYYETPQVQGNTLDSINPNLLFFEHKPNYKGGPSFINRINKVDRVFLMGRDATMSSAQNMECLLRHKNVPARIIYADELGRIYPTLSKRDLVLYYFNPLESPPASTIDFLAAAHVRCILAFISTSVPRSYLKHIDYFLYVTPYCPVDFLKDGPLLYHAANNQIIGQMAKRKKPKTRR